MPSPINMEATATSAGLDVPGALASELGLYDTLRDE